MLFLALQILGGTVASRPGRDAVDALGEGRYGVSAALAGDVRVPSGPRRSFTGAEYTDSVLATRSLRHYELVRFERDRVVVQPTVPSVQRWLGAAVLWSAIGAGLIGLAMWRRRALG